jgi:hypothetical protein
MIPCERETILGKLDREQGSFIFGADGMIVARIDDDGAVRLSRGYIDSQARAVAAALWDNPASANVDRIRRALEKVDDKE